MIGQGSPDIFIKAIGILSIILTFLVIYYLINIGNRFVDVSKKIKIKNKWILLVFIFLTVSYFLFKFFQKHPFLYDILITIIISIVLAYALNPLINKLEKRGIKRLEGVLIVYISILAIFFVLAFLIIPKSGKEIKRLVTDLPVYFDQLSNLIDELYTKYYSILGGLPPMFKDIETVVMDNIVNVENALVDALKNFLGAIIGMTSKIINIILTPILTLYFIIDKDYFVDKTKKTIPKKHREDVVYLATTIDTSLSNFIRGRLLMSLYVGVFTTIMLLIFGVDFAFVIGLVTGIFDVIPYIGPFIGYVPAMFFALIESPIKAIWVSILFVIIQWGENNILAPKIIGENMGIHPLTILLSIIIGGGIFGVFGMIISVPLVAVVKIIYEFIKSKMQTS
ncbi:MAG: AI-2E family transporter [Tissierella sp.]|uniref:AI-2E family transporter n=1 Tax=Tissierella sp. TaxID=41274 RepID=UPI003F9A6BAB